MPLPSFTTISKIHISFALPYGHEKREMIFYSSKHIRSHQVAPNVRKIRDQGSNFSPKTASFMLTSSTTVSKNPHLIRPLIRIRKKRNGFFIVVNALVANKWLLMLGNFETLGSKFRHETAGLLPSFTTISKNPFLALYKKKRPSFA